jgi:hypothetical protein
MRPRHHGERYEDDRDTDDLAQWAEVLLARVRESRRELCRTMRAVRLGRRSPIEIRALLTRARGLVHKSQLLRRQHAALKAVH